MSNERKVKFFRNKERGKAEPPKQPYVPQHQVLGIDPVEFKSAVVPPNTPKATPSTVNPRLPRALVRQSYGNPEITESIGKGMDVLPNVGNNLEHTWSSLDGEIVDDMSLDPNQQMIDNNDYVSEAALHLTTPNSSFMNKNQLLQEIEQLSEESSGFESAKSTELLEILEELQTTSYLLLVKGVPVCSGPKEEIEEQVEALVFGEHELCDGEPVPVDDIMVFNKLNVKVGVSLG
jgi:hypothetical protein